MSLFSRNKKVPAELRGILAIANTAAEKRAKEKLNSIKMKGGKKS